jgi:hypothetical protein
VLNRAKRSAFFVSSMYHLSVFPAGSYIESKLYLFFIAVQSVSGKESHAQEAPAREIPGGSGHSRRVWIYVYRWKCRKILVLRRSLYCLIV